MGITGYSESTEYGAPRTPVSAPDDYGWLGGKKRSTDDLGGLSLMGVRLYDPATGRFLTTDPVPGGNANTYTYPLDPINGYDLTGRMGGEGWPGEVDGDGDQFYYLAQLMAERHDAGESVDLAHGGERGGSAAHPTSRPSVNQMNEQIQRNQAPRGIVRIDPAKVKGEQIHAAFGKGKVLHL